MANLKEIVCTPENPFGVEREMSDADQKLYDDLQKQFVDNKSERQIAKIRQLRNQKLIETDYLATSDNVMSDEMKAFRKSMRDLPQDYSEADYDDLLARDEQGNLTHTVWEKP